MLAAAVGPALAKWLPDLLDLMFNCGLSEPLRDALVAITANIPPFLKPVQGQFSVRVGRWVLKFWSRTAFGPFVCYFEWQTLQSSWGASSVTQTRQR